ncbi:MAG: carbohydrate ABC transporter permease [Candidatus Rokubacteria bacterium]|nr:carbohydrate ABC transporter permease [Candidatus Rokubacteria bacterium]
MLLAATALPFLWQLLTSFKPEADLLRLPPFLPERWSIENYATVLVHPGLSLALLNSTGICLIATLLALGVGALAAYPLARLPLRGRGLWLAGILGASLLPVIALVSPLYLGIRLLGLRDTWLALIVPYLALSLPLTVWLLTAFLREVPREVEEAARLDGCSRFGILWRILLPLAAPGLFSTGVIVFVFNWNEFLLALTFTATDASRTVPVALALFPGIHEIPWGDLAAASIVVSLPPLALILGFHRWVIRGLTLGVLGRR